MGTTGLNQSSPAINPHRLFMPATNRKIDNPCSPRTPLLPDSADVRLHWGQLYGDSDALAIASAAERFKGMLLVITPDSQTAAHLVDEIRFYSKAGSDIHQFPDWETLPYDVFSPHQDIISERLETLYQLPGTKDGVLVVPITTLLQRVAPSSFLQANSLVINKNDPLDPTVMRQGLEQAGYQCVSQVMEHGEYALRGSILDIYPMGAALPYRIDLFDEEVESIRTFDPDSQLSIEQVDRIRMLPARELPLDKDSITRFRQSWRQRFEGDPNNATIYRDVSDGIASSGIEYYLPLFHEQTETLFDYLPAQTMVIRLDGCEEAAEVFEQDLEHRYEQRRHDIERPILSPAELYVSYEAASDRINALPCIHLQRFAYPPETATEIIYTNFLTAAPPALTVQPRAEQPFRALTDFLNTFPGRILFAAESAGRREAILDMLRGQHVIPKTIDSWQSFVESDEKLAITVAPVEQGLVLRDEGLAVITETQIYGERAHRQTRKARRSGKREAESIIQSLTDLETGAPVVHEEHGIGRYLGLQKLTVGGNENEFLTLEYAGGDKLYVPVSSLQLISRYTGASSESAPLHKLGSDHWTKTRRKAAERARDVATELLDIYSRRAAKKGYHYRLDENEYNSFASEFPFEETADQRAAIEDVLDDMQSEQPMDRVICGDVGFGKTEVAMRAAFVAAQNNRQVVVLVPTTLLAQQHYNNFNDRFSDWPFRIEVISRFKTGNKQEQILKSLADGKIDIIIGTHKLINKEIKYRDLGLVVIDEEHRFGVRQKEHLKSLRSEVDILTLTATPIPRTLNMSMSGLRDLSIIATPPAGRVAIKTFVSEWNDSLLQEAFAREIKRGGQIYFLHNEVSSIEKMADELQALIPDAKIEVAHGQMREQQLERVMLDFYHQRFNVLVSTTIIESGIDIPTANTMIINRADKLGLAQLHQLRGRVGRSHHRAYAYMIVPDRRNMTADAIKRIEAIESLEDLGSGFMLSTHDLEIRGAGELLGDEQSGQIHEIGFTMYTELLDRAVKALKSGKQPELDKPVDHGPEINLQVPALLPDDYLPDIHTRLITYKQIANCLSFDELREVQVEMIDRFGLLPEASKNLIQITRLKIMATPLGVRKIDANSKGARILLGDSPNINAARVIQLVQSEPATYKLEGQEKIRIIKPLDEPEQRFQVLEQILTEISPGT
jgi:transcription-repair coupling factor (superfamily II helicase)